MDEQKVAVSFLMPVYNAAQWLTESIESIKAQTFTSWECIIIDDASTDNTKSLLQSYTNHPQFKIIFNEQNLGLTKNLNLGLAFCKGDFIARLDADDVCHPKRLEKQLSYMLHHPHCMVLASLIHQIDEHGQSKGSWVLDEKTVTTEDIIKTLPKENCIAHPSVIIRRALFDVIKYNELQKNSQDWDLWLQAAAHFMPIAKLPEHLLDYRVHSKSVTAHSLQQSAFQKKHNFYKHFFAAHHHLPNKKFVRQIKFAYYKNYVLLTLSKIKRFVLPKK